MRAVLATLALCVVISTAQAQSSPPLDSGAAMVKGCAMVSDLHAVPTVPEAQEMGFCQGVVTTLVGLAPLLHMCLPLGLPIDEAVQVVLRSLQQHPQFRGNIDFTLVAMAALESKWSCKKR